MGEVHKRQHGLPQVCPTQIRAPQIHGAALPGALRVQGDAPLYPAQLGPLKPGTAQIRAPQRSA